MKTTTEQQFESLSIRVVPEIMEQIRKQAKNNERSLNREITCILKEHFQKKGTRR